MRRTGSLSSVSFQPSAVRGASNPSAPGAIDYRLARRHVLAEFKRGRLSRLDLCDAHPELVRAAVHLGEVAEEQCPICDERPLVHVSYVFGRGMPSFGRCISTKAELQRFSRAAGEFTCYVVEVCPDCRWNHLHHLFRLGRAASQ